MARCPGCAPLLQATEVVLPSRAPATLPNLLGLSPWLVIVPLVLLGGWWLVRQQAGSYLDGWDWKWAGLGLGVIGVLAWLVAWPTGWQYGIGIVGATGNLLLAPLWGAQALNWGSFVVLGMPVGAFIAALQTGELRWQVPKPRSALRMLLAGIADGRQRGAGRRLQHRPRPDRRADPGPEQPDGDALYLFGGLVGQLFAMGTPCGSLASSTASVPCCWPSMG